MSTKHQPERPTLETLPADSQQAALIVWQWLKATRTGFANESAITQAVCVEIHLQAVIQHPESLQDADLLIRAQILAVATI